MSPALIEIQTPSSSSSFSLSENPKNQISNPTFLFDISSNTFASTNPPPPMYEEATKLRPGRAVPRLVKVRKHVRSSRSNAVNPISSDFNPFCQGSVRVDDDSLFKDLCDKYNTVSDDSVFVFGANLNSVSNSNSEKNDIFDEMKNLNIGGGEHFKSAKDATFSTGDQSSSKNFGKSSSFVFGSSKLHDEMEKLNIEVDKNTNTGVDSKLPDEVHNLNLKDSGTGNVKMSNDAKFESKGSDTSSSLVFGTSGNGPSFLGGMATSVLPNEMKNLNIKDIGNGNANNFKKTDDEIFKPKRSDDNSFVFGTSVNGPSSLSGNAASVLPNDLKKLNINDSKVDEKVEETKVGNKNVFVFGNNKKDSASFSRSTMSTLPDEMSKLNVGSEFGNASAFPDATSSVNGQPKSKKSDINNFVFGSSVNGPSSLSGNAASVLPSDMKKLNIDDFKLGDKVKDTKASNKNAFVFGSNKKDSASFNRTTMGSLPDEMSKLKVGSEFGNANAFPDATSTSSVNAQPKVSPEKVLNDPSISNFMRGSFSFQPMRPSRNSSVGSDNSVQPNDDKSTGDSASSYSFYSAGVSFQSSGNVSEEPSVDSAPNKDDFVFGTPHTGFRTPKLDDSCSSSTNFFVGLNQKSEFSVKRGAVKDTRTKKKRDKVKQPGPVNQWPSQYNIAGQSNVSSENKSKEDVESPGHYSPMDVSPYPETLEADKSSQDTYVTFDYFQRDVDRPAADVPVFIDPIDEDLASATESLDINGNDAKSNESKEGSMDNLEKVVGEFGSGAESRYFIPKTEAATKLDAIFAGTQRDSDLQSHVASKEADSGMEFCFTSTSESVSGTNFAFAASTSAHGDTSTVKRPYKKKSRLKVGQDTYNSTLNAKLQFAAPDTFFPLHSPSVHHDSKQSRSGDSSVPQNKGDNRAEDSKFKQGSRSRAAATSDSHEACEKWRLRGNQAYANGNLPKAEDYYTRGLNCVPRNERSEECLNAVALCYSNRAAARMTSGRMRAALEDCIKAAEINPDFRKVQVRAANCHLALGEFEDALRYFKNSLPPGAEVCLDRKIVIEASNGLQKAQKAGEFLDRCGKLLRRRTSNDAETALQLIAEALLISPYSEKLVEMKGEALLQLRKYEEIIQLCEQTLESADKNSSSVSTDGSESINNWPSRLWRWSLMAKSNFYLGRLEETLTYIEKLEQEKLVIQKFGSEIPESVSTLAVTVRGLLRHKAAGNEAFQSGRHSEAVEHYTSALSRNLESRPFAAICFCNRAASHQALGQITDAIADCSLAIALDGNYPKAISRRATLHEMIRDYSQAAVDLQRLVSLLEKQTDEKANQSGKLARSSSCIIDIRQAHSRLSTMEEEARKGIPLDLYLILGIESSGVGTEIKKAYRRAALRHHPDKAAQVLPRSENIDDGVWKEIAEEVYKDADRLFKMIGEAYAVLSDTVKRFQYDEEEIRYTKKGNNCSTTRTPSDVPNSPFERSGSRRQWQDVRRAYSTRTSQFSESFRYF